jgi:hypothetical protein
MGTRNVRNVVPTDEPALNIFWIFSGETIYVFHALREQMDAPAVLRRQSFDLLDDAKLCTVATI